jgi:hypothetical protein
MTQVSQSMSTGLLLGGSPAVAGTARTVRRRCDIEGSGITLATAAEALETWPIRISELERGLTHDAQLARRSQLWLHHEQAA